MLIIKTDAAFDPVTKNASIAYVIQDFTSKRIIASNAKRINVQDNHQAEFEALIDALKYLIDHDLTESIIEILTDSKGLFLSIEKSYSKSYPAESQLITDLLSQFNLYYTKLISDKENKHAHRLANTALHKKKEDQ